MAQATRTQKITQVLLLLQGAQKKNVASALADHGFAQADLDNGWKLFQTAVGAVFSAVPSVSTAKELELLDQWENKWFPVVYATLEANFPEIHTKVFLNLSQTSGAWLVPSVQTFLERLAVLQSDEASAEDKAAAKLLTQRGLTDAVVAYAQGLVAKIQTIDDEDGGEEAAEAKKAAKKAAEDAMWNWYKEWSAIARVAIQSKKTLQSLGLVKPKAKKTVAAPDPADQSGD